MAQKKKLKARRSRPRTGRKPGRKIGGSLKRKSSTSFDDIWALTLEELFGKPKSKKKRKR